MDSFRYWAFISYSHRDSAWADWLHKSLEKYHLPKPLIGTVTERGKVPKRLSPIFRDRDELPSATDLGAQLRAALSGSASQIVICSPQSAKSRWVNEEILAFKRLGRENRIFCVVVGGEPNATDMPGREDEECFPPALRFKIGADGGLTDVPSEPIAADARPGKDGKANAKLKLISGLLGVGFDSLRRREQQRRNRRLFVLSCSATVGMVVTSSLAAYALMQRSAAQRQTLRAEAEARTAKETTRFLVDLFKISDPGEARGNSVTAREMLDKGAARMDGELSKLPAIHATLMDTLGTVYMGLGLYAQARPLLDRAVITRRTLVDADPATLSGSLSHQGELLFRLADYSGGEKAYREAIRIDSQRPKTRDSRLELADSLYGLGKLLDTEGHYPEAEKNLRAALQLQQEIYGSSDPAIARTLKDLARAMADNGDLNGAIPLMRQAVAMQRQLRGNEPHPDLAEVLNDMGVLLWQLGDLDETEKFYRESLAMKRRLLGDKHPEIAAGLENVAMSLSDKGDLAGAEVLYRQSLDMRRELLGPNHPEVGRTLLNLASLQYDRGDTQQALSNMRDVLSIYRTAYPPDHPDTARVLNVIGFWLTLAHEYPDADHYLSEALAMRRRLFGEHQPDVGSSLMHMAVLRDAQGSYSEALDLARSAKQIYTDALSADHWRTAIAEGAEGAALTGLGRYAEAETCLNHSNAILGKSGSSPLIYRSIVARYLDTLHRDVRLASAAPPAPAHVVAAAK
jgi:tetratricopeptide (TPR) repeat protein